MDIEKHHFKTIDSTNTWGKHHAHEFPRNKITLITADEQTAGRGRFKRHWESPPNLNIYATFCFFMEKHRNDIGNIPQLMAMSAADAVGSLDFIPKLKWPNDVLINNKKVAGILCETTPLSDFLCVIVGIGLNVNMPAEILQKIDRPATSLFAERGTCFDIPAVLTLLQENFLKNLEKFLEEGFFSFLEKYKELMVLSHSQLIRFHDNRTVWEGFYHSINHDGSLNLLLKDGTVKNFIAGEILPNSVN